MTQDLYYYEEGYFTPENYHGYIADAEADLRPYAEDYFAEDYTFEGARATLSCIGSKVKSTTAALASTSAVSVVISSIKSSSITLSSTSSVTPTGGVIRNVSSNMSSAFTQTATISHIEGADLFAMSNAALAAEVSRIRDNNINVTAAFTQVTAGAKFIHFSSDQISDSTISAVNTRVRSNQAAFTAAFSLSASVGKIVQGSVGSPSRTAKTITANGTAAISATQSKFGGSSIAFSGANGTYLGLASNTDFGFGTGDFTIEGWFYKTTTTTKFLFDTRTSLTENSVAVQSNSAGTLRLYVNGAFLLTTGATHTSNAWNHLAISRASGTTRFFINGAVAGTVADTTNYGSTKPLVVGALYSGTTAFAGYIDDFRVTKGLARYTATFTAPAAAFTNDTNTVLLVHGDTDISDDPGAGSGLQSAFTSSITGSRIKNSSSSLAVTATLSAIISHIEGADLQAFTNASLTTSITKYTGVSSALASTASASATGSTSKEFTIGLSSTSTVSAIISHIEGADLQAFNTASLTVNNLRNRTHSSDHFGDFTISLEALRVRFNQAAFTAAFSLGCDAIEIAGGEILEGAAALVSHFDIDIHATRKKNIIDCDVVVTATQTAVGRRLAGLTAEPFEVSVFVSVAGPNRIRNAEVTLSSATTQASQANKTVQLSATLSTAFIQTAIISHIEGADLQAFNTASLTATISVVKLISCNITSSTTVTANATINKVLESQLFSSSVVTVTANSIKNASSSLTSAFSQTSALGVVKQFIIAESSAFTPVVSCVVTKNSFAVLESNFVQTTQLVKTAKAIASLTTASSLAVTARQTARPTANISLASTLTAVGIRAIRQIGDPTFIGQALVNNNTVQASIYPDYGFFRLSIPTEVGEGGIGLTEVGKFNQSLKFDARGASTPVTHGPVTGSAGYLAIRGFDEYFIHTSTDGVTWTNNTSSSNPLTIPSQCVTRLRYINSKYFVIGNGPTTSGPIYISYSTDRINWTNLTINSLSRYVWDITWTGTQYLLSTTQNDGTAYVYWSTNLTTWTTRFSKSPPAQFNPVKYYSFVVSGTNVLVVGETYDTQYSKYVPYYAFSTNSGNTFTTSNIGPNGGSSAVNKYANDVATNGSLWVMVGSGGLIYTSTNLSTWTVRTSGTASDLYSIEYSFYTWVINGVVSGTSTGIILTSTDGITWTNRTVPTISFDSNLYGTNWTAGNGKETKPVYLDGKWIVYNYTSTDAITWTIQDYQTPNKQPFLQYPDDPAWSSWKSMDFWIYIPSHPGVFTHTAVASQTNDTNSWSIFLEFQQAGSTAIRIITQNYVNTKFVTTFNFGDWNHIRVVNNSGIGAVYLNGTRAGTTFSLDPTWGDYPRPLNIGYTAYIAESRYARPVDYFLDEIVITNELLNDPTATTITVPTTPWTNNEYTAILLHYDTSYADDPGTPYRNGTAFVNATFTEVVSVIKNITANTALTTTASLSITPALAKTASAGLSSNFSLTVSALDLDLANIALSSNSSLTASLNVIKNTVAALSSSAQVSAVNSRIRSSSVSLTAFVTQLLLGQRTQLATAGLSSSSTLTITVNKFVGSNAGLSSNSSLTSSIRKISTTSASLLSSSSLTVVVAKSLEFTSTESSTSTLAVTGRRIRSSSAGLTSSSTMLIDIRGIVRVDSNLFSNCSLTASAQVIKGAQANLTATGTVTTNAGKRVVGAAALQVSAFELVTGNVLNLTFTETWVIQAENRNFVIATENRLWTIPVEDRTYIIKG